MLKKDTTQKGNVLWFILIAIALTAALTLTFTRSNKTSGKNADKNQAKIVSLQVLNYARDIKNSIEKMRAVNGCSESEISFEHSFWGHAHYDITPTNTACQVFATDGGAQTPKNPPEKAGTEYLFIDRTSVDGLDIGTTACTPSPGNGKCVDLLLIMRNVDKTVCETFNKMNSISPVTPQDDPMSSELYGVNDGYANGSFDFANQIGSTGGGASNVDGKEYGCINALVGGDPDELVFFYALIKR